MFIVSGECRCGLKRDIECDDPDTLQQIKDTPCNYCGSKIKYRSGNEKWNLPAQNI